MSPIWKTTVLALLAATSSISIARCDEAIKRTPDGRYLVDLNGVTIALPDEYPKEQQTRFYVSTPPGSSPFGFYLNDLLRDPERLSPRLRSSEWSSVGVGTSTTHPHEIIGIPVVRGVNRVSVRVGGVYTYCEEWVRSLSSLRDIALDLAADQYGWTRQEVSKRPTYTIFIKFLDESARRTSRYYALQCDFSGTCSTVACRDGLSTSISFYSSNKIQDVDYSVKEFDQQVESGKKVLERMLVGRTIDFSQP